MDLITAVRGKLEMDRETRGDRLDFRSWMFNSFNQKEATKSPNHPTHTHVNSYFDASIKYLSLHSESFTVCQRKHAQLRGVMSSLW